MELTSYNGVAVLAFSPSAEFPRLSIAVLEKLGELLDEVQGSRLFNGVVISANAKSFATGADIAEVGALAGGGARGFAEMGQATCRRIESFPLPVVAAIRGYCLGGGLD